MQERLIRVSKNSFGIHSRKAIEFVEKASQYDAYIWLERNNEIANAKSLLSVLAMGIMADETILIVASGPEEKEAIDALEMLLS